MKTFGKDLSWGLLLAGVLGCGRETGTPELVSPKKVIEAYYSALLRRDWPSAFALLHPADQAGRDPREFSRLAQDYWRGLGFEPATVRVPFCHARGVTATAQVTLLGRPPACVPSVRAASPTWVRRETLALRRSEDGWRVLLPATCRRPASAPQEPNAAIP